MKTTKKDLAITILGNYEHFGCELSQESFNKVRDLLINRPKTSLEKGIKMINNVEFKTRRAEARFVIHVFTGILLPE